MPRDKEAERTRDVATLDRMIARMERQADEFDSPQITALFAKELPRLLERRARLLGHDLAGAEQPAGGVSGTLAELERKLALVGPGKAS